MTTTQGKQKGNIALFTATYLVDYLVQHKGVDKLEAFESVISAAQLAETDDSVLKALIKDADKANAGVSTATVGRPPAKEFLQALGEIDHEGQPVSYEMLRKFEASSNEKEAKLGRAWRNMAKGRAQVLKLA